MNVALHPRRLAGAAYLRLVPPPTPASAPRRFLLSITHADGRVENLDRLGGTSVDHVLEGIDRGGLGATVRVVPMPAAEAA